MWSFNHTQLQRYAVMKLILKEYVKTKCDEKHKRVLCSYFIKTFLFWQFEKMDRSFWEIANLSGCIIFLFHEFYICIQTGTLRHYFVSRFNLLEIQLTPDAQTELLKIFGNVIEAGISFIGQSNSLKGVFSNFIAARHRRHCEMRTTEIHKRRILDNDENTMNNVNQIMVHTHALETKYKSPPSDFLFSVFVRLTSGSSSTAFDMLTIRIVCRLIVIKTLNISSHQGNRYRNYLMRALSKNIYGIDIASSKLWLRTFLLQQGDYDGSLQWGQSDVDPKEFKRIIRTSSISKFQPYHKH